MTTTSYYAKRQPRPELAPPLRDLLRAKRFAASAVFADQYGPVAAAREHQDKLLHQARPGTCVELREGEDLQSYLWRDQRRAIRLTTDSRGTGLHPVWRTVLAGIVLVWVLVMVILLAGCGDSNSTPQHDEWEAVSDINEWIDASGQSVAFDIRIRKAKAVGSRCYQFMDGGYQCWLAGMVCDLEVPPDPNAVKSIAAGQVVSITTECRTYSFPEVQVSVEEKE